jgi:hypothetical protein
MTNELAGNLRMLITFLNKKKTFLYVEVVKWKQNREESRKSCVRCLYYSVFHLSAHRARRFYRIESLHPPGHPVRAGMLRTAIKKTHGTMAYFNLKVPCVRGDIKTKILCL